MKLYGKATEVAECIVNAFNTDFRESPKRHN